MFWRPTAFHLWNIQVQTFNLSNSCDQSQMVQKPERFLALQDQGYKVSCHWLRPVWGRSQGYSLIEQGL